MDGLDGAAQPLVTEVEVAVPQPLPSRTLHVTPTVDGSEDAFAELPNRFAGGIHEIDAEPSRTLLWSITPSQPSLLSLSEHGVEDLDAPGGATSILLGFPSQLLPTVCCANGEGVVWVFALGADRTVYRVRIPLPRAGRSGGRQPILSSLKSLDGAMNTYHLPAGGWQPTCIALSQQSLCIGTDTGSVFVLSTAAFDGEYVAPVELRDAGGMISRLLSGIIAKAAAPAVASVLPLPPTAGALGARLLAVHSDGSVRVWDAARQQQVFVGSLPGGAPLQGGFPTSACVLHLAPSGVLDHDGSVPAALDSNGEVLLAVQFGAHGTGADASAFGAYSLSIRDGGGDSGRGGGLATYALSSLGSDGTADAALADLQYGVVDYALHAAAGEGEVQLWTLSIGLGGPQARCVVVGGAEAGPQPARAALLQEDRWRGMGGDALEGEQDEEELYARLQARWPHEGPPAAPAAAGRQPGDSGGLPGSLDLFCDAEREVAARLLGPGLGCRHALREALRTLGHQVSAAELAALGEEQLLGRVLGTLRTMALPPTDGDGGGGGNRQQPTALARLRLLLQRYRSAWQELHAPCALVRSQRGALGVLRCGPVLCMLRPASAAERLLAAAGEGQEGSGGAGVLFSAGLELQDIAGRMNFALLQGFLLSGAHPGRQALPAFCSALFEGPLTAALATGGQASRDETARRTKWATQRRRVLLHVSRLLQQLGPALPSTVAEHLSLLAGGAPNGSNSGAPTSAPSSSAAAQPWVERLVVASAQQLAEARLEAAVQLAVLCCLAAEAPGPSAQLDAATLGELRRSAYPRVLCELQRCLVAYWLLTSSPPAAGALGDDPAALGEQQAPSALLGGLRLGSSSPNSAGGGGGRSSLGGSPTASVGGGGAGGGSGPQLRPLPLEGRGGGPRRAGGNGGGGGGRAPGADLLGPAAMGVSGCSPSEVTAAAVHGLRSVMDGGMGTSGAAATAGTSTGTGGSDAHALLLDNDDDTPLRQLLTAAQRLYSQRQPVRLLRLLRLAHDLAASSPALQFLQGYCLAYSLRACSGGGEQQQQADTARAVECVYAAAAAFGNSGGGGGGVVSERGDAAAAAQQRRRREASLAALQACLDGLAVELTGEIPEPAASPEHAALRYYELAMLMFGRAGSTGGALAFTRAALQQAGRCSWAGGPQEGLAVKGRLWSNLFLFALDAAEYEAAYAAAVSNPVGDLQLDCLQRLVHSMANAGAARALCSLPYAGSCQVQRTGGPPQTVSLLDEVRVTLVTRADTLDLAAVPQPHRLLYDWCVCRGNFQGAAGAMLALARRLATEWAERPGVLSHLVHALGAALCALRLVAPEDAWLVDPAQRSSSGGNASATGHAAAVAPPPPARSLAAARGQDDDDEEMDAEEMGAEDDDDDAEEEEEARAEEVWDAAAAAAAAQPLPCIVTCRELAAEYALSSARLLLATAAGVGEASLLASSAGEVLQQLCGAGLHDQAAALCEQLYCGGGGGGGGNNNGDGVGPAATTPTTAQQQDEQQQQQRQGGGGGGSSGGGQDDPRLWPALEQVVSHLAAAAARAQAAAGRTGPSAQDAAAAAGLWGGGGGHSGGGHSASGGGGSPDALWMSLHRLLQRHAGHAHGARLQQAAIGAVLSCERRMKLPVWLTSMAEADAGAAGMAGSGADPAALLRLYLRYDCLGEAAALVTRQFGAWDRQVAAGGGPSASSAQGRQAATATSWFPYGLIELLQARLQGANGGGGAAGAGGAAGGTGAAGAVQQHAADLEQALDRHKRQVQQRSAVLRQLVA